MLVELPPRLRHLARAAYYRLVPSVVARRIKRFDGAPRVHETASYWNDELSGRMSAPNLNGRVSNALRDSTAAVLIEACGPPPTRVLDLGCGFGELAHALVPRGCCVYHGVDLSDYVIERVRSDSRGWAIATRCALTFTCADLRDFSPHPDAQYDVLVFNEVLKYLEVDEAVAEIERLSPCLAPDGVVCVNISGDPKSQAVFRALESHFEWIYGTVYQQRPDRAVYRLTQSDATPPFLVGVFRTTPAPRSLERAA